MTEATGTPVIPKDDNLTRTKENIGKVKIFLSKRWKVTTFEVFVCIWLFALLGVVNAVLSVSVAAVISACIWLMYKKGIET